MSDVTRDEFERLVNRVGQLEHRHDAAMELIAAEPVGLRAHIDTTVAESEQRIVGRVDSMEERFGNQFELQGRMLGRVLDKIDPGWSDESP